MERNQNYKRDREKFVSNLYALMDKRNLSCQHLSNLVGSNNGYINQIVNGKKDPSFEMLSKIAVALKVQLAELFK